jgi:hypothetical protein
VPVANIALEDAVKLLRGTVGSEVELTVAFPGSPVSRRIQMVREAIDVTGVKFRIIDMNVGLLTLTGFNEQTPGKVLDALGLFTAKTVRGIVLKIRLLNEPGYRVWSKRSCGFSVVGFWPLSEALACVNGTGGLTDLDAPTPASRDYCVRLPW